jgi:hypothetical protein
VPTPWAAGFTSNDGKPQSLTLGSSRVWLTSEPQASCGFLQVEGDFGALTSAIEQKKGEMAELGVQMIASNEADKSPEAYATVALRQSSQSSSLTQLSRALSQCLTDVISMAAWWYSNVDAPQELQETYNVKMNLDFMGDVMDAADVVALVSAWIQGGISPQTLFYNLKRGEIIEDTVTFEEEMARIKKGKSLMLVGKDAQLQTQSEDHSATLQSSAQDAAAKASKEKQQQAKTKGAPPPKQSAV